ncbi:MAG: LysR family transcriptional regulator [Serratia marcescens]|uniref:LysR substrate-binding domain-containing protein n=1 Tax=Serratia marcescens TaxID=615 RepID=UPI0018D7B99E|nr:LysR family transcriptional regulator [Serratia marcescens]MDU4691264.1 LysR family transcriptional regulator [Serratia marcescens]HAT3854981.1 LysR family transcriptional regulator [Serratia marcescens]HBH6869302.1 LysR family transcriptional regulator [Serratia marcescens]HEJ6925488.1 LysR family transcriptional regulator [Serratia marcescens]
MNNLKRLDLNLLVTLEALLSERSVTRAAARLNLSQPSVSIQLAKLREIYRDPLLLPNPHGMLPTARALGLLAPLRQTLADVGRLVAPDQPFDPRQAEVTWQLAAADAAEYAILLPMLPRLRLAAPKSRLAIREAAPKRMSRDLADGVIDLGFLSREEAPAELRHRPLFHENYLLVGRRDHPLLQRPPSLEQFCQLEFVMVSQDGGGFRTQIDTLLAAQGLTRRVVMSVPHFLFIPALLAKSDMVAMLPSRMLGELLEELRTCAAPLEMPGYDMVMVWHERSHLDPAHSWLREQVVAALGPL